MNPRRRLPQLLLALLIASAAAVVAKKVALADSADSPATQPACPIQYEAFTHTDPPLKGYVARVDLSDPRVRVTVAPGGPDPDGNGPWATVLSPVSVVAKAHDFDLAVNAGYFSSASQTNRPGLYQAGDPANSSDILFADGRHHSPTRQGPALTILADGSASIGTIKSPLPTSAITVLGGGQQIVFRGKNNVTTNAPTDLAPRTAVGLSADNKTLILLVVDGRRPKFSAGLTTAALADEMIRLGAANALILDGGGSSTFVRKSPRGSYDVLNTPSDGSKLPLPLSLERPVAYTLGVRLK